MAWRSQPPWQKSLADCDISHSSDTQAGIPACAPHKETPPPLDRQSALFIDADGTLLEIAPRPELVRVPADLPALLGRWAGERGGALALISGRPLADLDRLLQPWHGAAAGLHGMERRRVDGSSVLDGHSPQDAAAAASLDRLRPALDRFARRSPGVWLEDKGRTLALHYRAAAEKGAEIRDLAERLVAGAGGHLRLIAGKMVVELQPQGQGKDGAIAAFMAEMPFHGRRPVFLGDDATDEDGFVEVNRRGGWSIRIGEPSLKTAAAFTLPSVEAALIWLAADRQS